MELTETQKKISIVCDSLKEFLLEKNKRYGNSALEPIGVFSKLSSGEGISLRLDDKIKRIKNSNELRKNDCVDTMGYLLLKCIDEGWLDFKDQLD